MQDTMRTEYRNQVLESIRQIGGNTEELSREFYRDLFHRDLSLKSVFPGNVVTLNRKFINMFATFSQIEHLEKIGASVEKMGERHFQHYGAIIRHFDLFEESLMQALAFGLKERFTPELETAWRHVYKEVAEIMKRIAPQGEAVQVQQPRDVEVPADFLQRIGGPERVMRVHERFYEVLFADPWIGQFFYGKHESVLATKQTQFMVAAFGGRNDYTGDTPAFVHMHMFITAEQADQREQILRDAILADGLSEADADIWLSVDSSFRAGIVKEELSECVMKCRGQMPIRAKKPEGYQYTDEVYHKADAC